MKGVLAISKDGDRFTAVEKSITDGTVADTMSFELREILNFHGFSGSTGGENDGAGFDLCGGGRNQIVAVPADPNYLILQKRTAEILYLFSSVFNQFMTGEGMIQSEIIFNFFCFFQSTVIFSNDGSGKSTPENIKSGGQTSRSAADDDNILHKDYLLVGIVIPVRCLLSV